MSEVRYLSGLEKFLDSVDLIQPINFAIIASIDGPLSLHLLRQGSAAACARYPDSVLIPHRRGSEAPFFRCSPFLPSIEIVGDHRIDRSVMLSINRSFDLGRECPIRIRWHRQPNHHVLIITFLHTIADASSGLNWVNALLEMMDCELLGDAFPQRVARAQVQSSIELEKSKSEVVAHRPVRLSGAQFSNKRETGVVGIEFSRAETVSAVNWATRLGVSMNSLLTAAHLKSVQGLFGQDPLMSLSFPVDLRRGRGLPLDAYGCHVSESRITQRVYTESTVSGLARRLESSLSAAIKKAKPWNERLEHPLSAKAIYEARATTAVSNLGRYEPFVGQRFKVVRAGFAVGCSILGDQVMTVVTTHDQLTAMLCWTLDTVRPEQIHDVATRFRSTICATSD